LPRGDPQDAYSDFERRFAEFLDKAGDVLHFSSLGITEQGEDNWIVETKGRIWEGPDHVSVQDQRLSPQYNSLECRGYRAE
jgi:hypothetical protein